MFPNILLSITSPKNTVWVSVSNLFITLQTAYPQVSVNTGISFTILKSTSYALSNEGVTFASAEVTMIPQTMVELTSEDDIKKMRRILALLDEEDDVQNVYHNWDEPVEDEE